MATVKNTSKHGRNIPPRFRAHVTGDSMEPLYPAGTRLEFARIEVCEAVAGKDYLVATGESLGCDLTTFKRLVAVRRGVFTFRVINEMFPDVYRVQGRDILALASPEYILQPVREISSDNIDFVGQAKELSRELDRLNTMAMETPAAELREAIAEKRRITKAIKAGAKARLRMHHDATDLLIDAAIARNQAAGRKAAADAPPAVLKPLRSNLEAELKIHPLKAEALPPRPKTPSLDELLAAYGDEDKSAPPKRRPISILDLCPQDDDEPPARFQYVSPFQRKAGGDAA